MKLKMKKAFTLAEVLITLTVIGIITAVIIPVAIHSKPDENVMKFKKAHNTLYQVISTLINSDEYFLNGDLGIRSNGNPIDKTHDGDTEYFCRSFADVLSAKSVSCINSATSVVSTVGGGIYQGVDESIAGKAAVDERCKSYQERNFTKRILSNDNVSYYAVQLLHMGILMKDWYGINSSYCTNNPHVCTDKLRYFNGGNPDDFGNDRIYAVFCVDIDEFNSGEDPFGYGIRADGKILVGNRAQDWLSKSIQN